MENRIHNPHAMADSKSSSPYSPSVLPERACLAQRRPVRNRMIHCPLVRVIPRAANPIRKAEAQTEPEAISTQSLRLHAGTAFSRRFLRSSANTEVKITRIPAAKASFIPEEKRMIPRAKASAGYFNFVNESSVFLFHCCKKLYASLIPVTAAVEDMVAPATAFDLVFPQHWIRKPPLRILPEEPLRQPELRYRKPLPDTWLPDQ